MGRKKLSAEDTSRINVKMSELLVDVFHAACRQHQTTASIWVREKMGEIMLKLVVNHDGPFVEWWNQGGAELWHQFSESKSVRLTATDAVMFLRAAAKIPGWGTNEHPIAFAEEY